MKILSVESIREADAYTIKNEPIASINLMERAATRLYEWIRQHSHNKHKIHIYCGLGNNGGDGLALGRLLAKDAYEVGIYIIRYADNSSKDFQKNEVLLHGVQGLKTMDICGPEDMVDHESGDIIIDAIFGSGLSRGIGGFIGKVIDHINHSDCVTISIDIPSGLFADHTSLNEKAQIIKADYTLSFQFPKLAFMFPETDVFVGKWHILDIGLHPDYIHQVKTKNNYLLHQDIKPLLMPRSKFSHKGSYGHALLIAGEYGKMGAAILASRACLRTGVGLLHTHIPKSGFDIMQIASPETMLSIDRYENHFSEVPDLNPFSAIGIGPGLGTAQQSQMALKVLIQEYLRPIVFDADALNILAENKTWLAFLPKGSILTPHPKEFERLVGKWYDDFERLQLQRDLARKYGVYVVLKGAQSSVCFPDGQCFFNSTGNPGMATAGSGDVLTGMITGLLAQGYSPGMAAIIGVYTHGLAADIAAEKMGMNAMIASDITAHLSEAFLELLANPGPG